MRIMSSWRREEVLPGITLWLGAFTPKDARHDDGLSTTPRLRELIRPEEELPDLQMADQSTGTTTTGDTKKFAPVPVITKLSIKANTFRNTSATLLGQVIRHGMPCLRSIHTEKWSHPRYQAEYRLKNEYQAILFALPIAGIKTHSIFCDVERNGTPLHLGNSWLTLSEEISIGAALAAHALDLLSCKLSFFIDAMSFLRCSAFLVGRYPKLEHLALTLPAMSREKLPRKTIAVRECLLAAATSATYMPKLKALDIWYGEGGDVFLVRLAISSNQLQVKWASTWHEDDSLDKFFEEFSDE